MKHLLLALLLPFLAQQALAFEHVPSGLRIDLPDGFLVEPLAAWEVGRGVVGFSIRSRDPGISADLTGEICKIAYEASVERSPLTQVELNNVEAGDITLAAYRSLPVPGMKVIEAMPFLSGDIAGVELVATSKHVPNFMMLVSTFQTPAGRTALSCSALRAQFDQSRLIFEAIRSGIVPPR